METKYIKKDTDLGDYYQTPKWLDELKLTRTSEKMYVRLLDRIRISATNDRYMDANGNLYVLFTYEGLCEALNRKETSIKAALTELEERNLIARERQGIGLPNRIFVKMPVGVKKTTNVAGKSPSNGQETNDHMVGNATGNNMRANNKNFNNSKKQNRFINYTQSEWDFARMEEMERNQRLRDVEQQRQVEIKPEAFQLDD